MSQELWTSVDRYFTEHLVPADPVLQNALSASSAAGLPDIHVSPAQGKMLHLLAKVSGARKILELGTLAGYSTIWLARALPAGGKLISLELEAKHAEVARGNLARAGLGEITEVRVGRAIDSLPKLVSEGAGPFDLIFIDADKASIPEYFTWALKLSRVGTFILVDNVVRGGAVADANSADASVRGVRRLTEMLAHEPRVTSTVIQTVGVKGYDGIALIRVEK